MTAGSVPVRAGQMWRSVAGQAARSARGRRVGRVRARPAVFSRSTDAGSRRGWTPRPGPGGGSPAASAAVGLSVPAADDVAGGVGGSPRTASAPMICGAGHAGIGLAVGPPQDGAVVKGAGWGRVTGEVAPAPADRVHAHELPARAARRRAHPGGVTQQPPNSAAGTGQGPSPNTAARSPQQRHRIHPTARGPGAGLSARLERSGRGRASTRRCVEGSVACRLVSGRRAEVVSAGSPERGFPTVHGCPYLCVEGGKRGPRSRTAV